MPWSALRGPILEFDHTEEQVCTEVRGEDFRLRADERPSEL